MSNAGADRASPLVGKILADSWRIDARLARGGVATVYTGTARTGERVAIKLLHPEFSRNEDVRSRFLREGLAAQAVGHPGVVRVLDNGVARDGSAYLVMELIDGEVLEDLRERLGGRIPLDQVLAFADQILDIVAAAHGAGIIHRDLKPENIMIVAGGRVKVLDFGMAHLKQTVMEREATKTGLLLGTPEYMPPEQAAGTKGQVDEKTDIWAVGATLFTLLSGESVHEYEGVAQLLLAAATRPARSLASVAPQLPRDVVAVIDRSLAYEKRDRWPTARAMQEALRAVSRARAGAAPAPFDDATLRAAPHRPAPRPAAGALPVPPRANPPAPSPPPRRERLPSAAHLDERAPTSAPDDQPTLIRPSLLDSEESLSTPAWDGATAQSADDALTEAAWREKIPSLIDSGEFADASPDGQRTIVQPNRPRHDDDALGRTSPAPRPAAGAIAPATPGQRYIPPVGPSTPRGLHAAGARPGSSANLPAYPSSTVVAGAAARPPSHGALPNVGSSARLPAYRPAPGEISSPHALGPPPAPSGQLSTPLLVLITFTVVLLVTAVVLVLANSS